MKSTFTFGEVLSFAWEKTKKFGFLYAFILFVISILGILLSIMGRDFSSLESFLTAETSLMSQLLGNFMPSLLQTLVMPAIYTAVLRQTRGDFADFSAKDYPADFKCYLKYFVLTFIVNTLVVVGYLFCIVPGIYLQGRFAFAQYFFLDNHEDGIFEAMDKSWKMTENNAWAYAFTCFFLSLIGFSGFLFCYLPGFFTLVLPMFGTAYLYNKHVGNFTEQDAYTKWYRQ